MKFSLCNHHTFTSSPVLEPCEHGHGSGSIDGQGYGRDLIMVMDLDLVMDLGSVVANYEL